MVARVRRMRQLGQSVWLNGLSRELLRSGRLDCMIARGEIAGVTLDPASFAPAIEGEPDYAGELSDLPRETCHPRDALMSLFMADARRACDLFRPSWDHGAGRAGWVSVMADPRFADNRRRLLGDAMRIRGAVRRTNVYVGIPTTPAGLGALEDCVASGISVNATHVFCARHHREAITGYLRGLVRFIRAGGAPATVASIATFGIPAIDAEVQQRLRGHYRRGVGLAVARTAYETFENAFGGDRWETLEQLGAHPQWCCWSIGTANEAEDTLYATNLVGAHTVCAVSEEAVRRLRQPGDIRPNLVTPRPPTTATAALMRLGIDVNEVGDDLQRRALVDLEVAFAEAEDAVRRTLDRVQTAA